MERHWRSGVLGLEKYDLRRVRLIDHGVEQCEYANGLLCVRSINETRIRASHVLVPDYGRLPVVRAAEGWPGRHGISCREYTLTRLLLPAGRPRLGSEAAHMRLAPAHLPENETGQE